jgi:hypothetical protein
MFRLPRRAAQFLALPDGAPSAFRQSREIACIQIQSTRLKCALNISEDRSVAMTVELYGYQYSVYSWIARLALAEKGEDHHWIEVNPFAPDVSESYLAIHPFKRVPALVHDGFQVYETGAITRYVDEAFARGATSSSPSSTATFTGHWCGRYFPIACFGLALGGRRMRPRYKRVWRQHLTRLPHWSGWSPTPNISAVPGYLWPTSIWRR